MCYVDLKFILYSGLEGLKLIRSTWFGGWVRAVYLIGWLRGGPMAMSFETVMNLPLAQKAGNLLHS
jgi:hypothetical protein